MAKQLAMLQKTPEGAKYRQYFIEKYDIYREKNEKTGRYIYTEKSLEEIGYILKIKEGK